MKRLVPQVSQNAKWAQENNAAIAKTTTQTNTRKYAKTISKTNAKITAKTTSRITSKTVAKLITKTDEKTTAQTNIIAEKQSSLVATKLYGRFSIVYFSVSPINHFPLPSIFGVALESGKTLDILARILKSNILFSDFVLLSFS